MEFHRDTIEKFRFVLVELGKDGVLVLEGVLNGREMAVCSIGALSPRSVGNDVIIEEVSFFEDGGELGSNGGVDEGIEIVEEGDGASVY